VAGSLTPALRLEAVSFSYGVVRALVDVSLALAPGERVALLGRNGAGKSTLMRLITGLIQPAGGTVWVGDWDTRHRTPEALARSGRVGCVFQHAEQQLFGRTVRDDVSFGPRVAGVPAPEATRRVERALRALELERHAEEHPYDLPPAFRKLAALAGAFALEPALLVLDEPTSGLDRALRMRVTRALLERSAAGVTVLVITHDRALVLDSGRLMLDGPLPALLGDAARLESLGLALPPVAALSAALGLPGRPTRQVDAARALARVAAGRPVP